MKAGSTINKTIQMKMILNVRIRQCINLNNNDDKYTILKNVEQY